MLPDASISRAVVSKAKPPAPRPAIRHTHAGRRPQRGAGNRGVGTGDGAAYRLQVAAVEEEGQRAVAAKERRDGGGGMSVRAAASGTEMRGEGGRRRGRGRRRRETALRAYRGGATRRGGAARRIGAARRGEAAVRTGPSRKKGAIWGKTV
jgi:hypothetical protein